jgi:signal transduction histidine kinase
MDVSLLKMQLVGGSAAMQKVEEMRELVEKTIQIVRNVVSHLRPAALNFGLASALEWLAEDFSRHTQIVCHFHREGAEPHLADARATAIFRIVQESLTNVARHANASRVDVTLANTEAGIELIISDNGRGFDMAAARAGYSYGLQGYGRTRPVDRCTTAYRKRGELRFCRAPSRPGWLRHCSLNWPRKVRRFMAGAMKTEFGTSRELES